MKEVAFLDSLEKLFDITVKSLQSSQLITDEDRNFLQNHWMNTISSTPDRNLQKTLDLEDRRLPEIPSYFKEDIADILDFVNDKLDQEDHLPRCLHYLQRRYRRHPGFRQRQTRPRRSPTPRRLQGTPGACQADPW